MPEVSILIPVYNTEKFLTQSIQSVLNQTFEDWELIILDDNSDDDSFEIAKNFAQKDSRIKAYKNENNLGMVKNWNKGIALCGNHYFIKLDSDDWWHEKMLDESVEILNANPEVALVFTKYVKVNAEGEVISETNNVLPDFAKNKSFDCINLVKTGAEKMLQHDILRQGLSVMRRKVFDDIGTYRFLQTPETQGSSDTEFYFRVGCHYKIYSLDREYYYYRVHDSNIAARDERKSIQERKIYEIRNSIIGYYFLQRKVSYLFYWKFKLCNRFIYNFHLVYFYRQQGSYLNMFLKFLENMIMNPFKTANFYGIRIKKHLMTLYG